MFLMWYTIKNDISSYFADYQLNMMILYAREMSKTVILGPKMKGIFCGWAFLLQKNFYICS